MDNNITFWLFQSEFDKEKRFWTVMEHSDAALYAAVKLQNGDRIRLGTDGLNDLGNGRLFQEPQFYVDKWKDFRKGGKYFHE